MTLNQLSYFYQAAILQHFNQAAEKMNISVITIESSREDTVEVRKEKYETVFKKTLKYLKME